MLMKKIYEGAKSHPKRISRLNCISNLLTLYYFTKACYVCFLKPCYFNYTYEYILRCFIYVLNKNVFSKGYD